MTLASPPFRFARPLIAAWVLAGLLGTSAAVAFLGGAWEADPVLDPSGWRTVATLEEVQAREVLSLPELGAFLVTVPEGEEGATAPPYAQGHQVLALSDDPHHIPGERVRWCASAMVFESLAHGEKFDRYGAFMDGPAPKGLDLFPVRIVEGEVHINPDQPIPGPARGQVPVQEPAGPFCAN